MIFYGNGIIWDAEKDCILCRFKDGEFETEDRGIITLLKSLNLEFEGEEPDGEEYFIQDINEAYELAIKEDYTIFLNSKKVADLRGMAKEKGLEGYGGMKKEELIELLLEGAE